MIASHIFKNAYRVETNVKYSYNKEYEVETIHIEAGSIPEAYEAMAEYYKRVHSPFEIISITKSHELQFKAVQ